jgi:hypothetical protein
MPKMLILSFGWHRYVLAIALVLAPALLYAECRATSAKATMALIEMYTSEGCDSCPPADRWLAGLKLGNAATPVVALAFHVDYWDQLGWRDRFGSAAFTRRQYEQASRRGDGFVYTPQVLLQGRDFESWRGSDQPAAAIASINAKPARAAIEVTAQAVERDAVSVDLHVQVPEARDRAYAVAAVALTQDGLASEVKAGENAGKRLAHEHVVRAWEPGLSVGPGGDLHRSVRFTLPSDRGLLSIVAFAENARTGEVLQAVALPLCAP